MKETLTRSNVKISNQSRDNLTVGVLEVVARTEFSFLKARGNSGYDFFVRQGNRTISLDMPELAEHIKLKLDQ